MKMPNPAESDPEIDAMLPEYDFSGKQGMRGKFYVDPKQGYRVEVMEADGTVTVQNYILIDGAVVLDPDVRAVFPTSESVNNALRGLIELAQKTVSST